MASAHLQLAETERRNSTEIKIDILRSVSNGIWLPTRIMQAANLSWARFRDVSASLVEAGLLLMEDTRIAPRIRGIGMQWSRRRYMITEKGLETLRLADEVEKRLSNYHPEVDLVTAPQAPRPAF
jgi:predicted transcriptional regulator